MADEYIRREDAIKTAVNAFNAWNLAMAAADGTREINLVFRRKELCKAVELVFSWCTSRRRGGDRTCALARRVRRLHGGALQQLRRDLRCSGRG